MQEIKILAQNNMKKKNNEKVIIICCIIAGILMYIIPFGLVFGLAYFDTMKYDDQEFRIADDKVYVGGLVISDIKGTYYEDSNKYVITGSFENIDKEELDIYFDLYDSEGYIIGEAFSYLELKKNEKYKFKAIYNENDAKEITNFKIKRITCY